MLLAIYGAGGLGREIYDLALRCNSKEQRWAQIVFVDDFQEEGEFFSTKRMRLDSLKKCKGPIECIVGVGEPSIREKLFKKLVTEDFKLATLLDPTAIISPSAKIEMGTIVCEFSTLHAGVEFGNNVFVQPFCNIGHDIKVGDHSVLSSFCAPGGNIVIGERVYIGMHATLKENLKIGHDAIIGMGSVVYRDVPAKVTVLGNPARVTRGNDERRVFSTNS